MSKTKQLNDLLSAIDVLKKQADQLKEELLIQGFEGDDYFQLQERVTKTYDIKQALQYENWEEMFDISKLSPRKNVFIPEGIGNEKVSVVWKRMQK